MSLREEVVQSFLQKIAARVKRADSDAVGMKDDQTIAAESARRILDEDIKAREGGGTAARTTGARSWRDYLRDTKKWLEEHVSTGADAVGTRVGTGVGAIGTGMSALGTRMSALGNRANQAADWIKQNPRTTVGRAAALGGTAGLAILLAKLLSRRAPAPAPAPTLLERSLGLARANPLVAGAIGAGGIGLGGLLLSRLLSQKESSARVLDRDLFLLSGLLKETR